MLMLSRKNRRGFDEHCISGRNLNLNDLKHEAQHLGNQYLIKENIPPSPKPEFHVTHLKHDTAPWGIKGIRKDEGFRVPHGGLNDPHKGILVWWNLAVGPEEVKSAETRLLRQNFSDLTEDQAAMHPNFLYKFTTSPAFLETSFMGSYRFTFPLKEVLEAYSQQFCSGDQPVMRVYETALYPQEVQHTVLVHSPANDELFSEYPLLTDDPNAICVYKDGRFIWRPYAICGTHKYELICRPEKKQMEAQECDVEESYIWDYVAIVLHVDQQVLKFDADKLRKNLKFCDKDKASFGTRFNSYEDAKDKVKELWPDCDSPLEKTCSLEQHFTVPDLRLVLVGRTGSGKSSSGNIILGREAFSTGDAAAAGNTQCCLQMEKVSYWNVSIVNTPGLSETPEVKTEIKRCIDMSAPGPHAFLLVVRLGTLIDKEAVRQMEEIFGRNVWSHIFIVLTHDDQLEIGDEILNRTKTELKDILPSGVEDRYYVLNNKQQVWDLLDAVAKTVVETKGAVYTFIDE